MKFIVIGLGYFGSRLAIELTRLGHEVIGIDNREDRIDELKDSVSVVMEMDTTNERAVKSLPLNDTDAVIVGIGEDVASSILTLAVLKGLNIPRIIGRAISPVHQSILTHIGIKEIVHPEEETAFSVSSMLQLKNALKVTQLDEENVIAELYVPKKYIGHNLESLNMQKRFNLKLVAVKTSFPDEEKTAAQDRKYTADFNYDPLAVLTERDILVIAGKLNEIKKLIGE